MLYALTAENEHVSTQLAQCSAHLDADRLQRSRLCGDGSRAAQLPHQCRSIAGRQILSGGRRHRQRLRQSTDRECRVTQDRRTSRLDLATRYRTETLADQR